MDENYVPQYLDAPTRIILWTIDELIVFATPIIIFMLIFNQTVLGLIIGSVSLLGLKKLKGEQGQFFLCSLVYWYFPTIIRFKSTPPSYMREYLG